jgi:hypothetical protein
MTGMWWHWKEKKDDGIKLSTETYVVNVIHSTRIAVVLIEISHPKNRNFQTETCLRP